MLIPEFKINQDDQHIIVNIRVPYIKVTACQFYIEQKTFKFYLKPYLLCLNFQQCLKQAEQPAKAIYNHDKYILTVYLQKKTKKQFFGNLDLLSNILVNKKSQKNNEKKQKKVLIQVLDEKGQKIIQSQESFQNQNQYNYGFCANYHNVFKNLQEQVLQLFMFDPKDVSINQRYQLQRKITDQQFDQNSYMYDKMSNFQQIDRIVESSEVQDNLRKMIKEIHSKQPQNYQKFKSQFKIPNKQIIIPKGQHANIWKQLFSIVFCYIYQNICMQGQMGVQSGKTINKTNGVFSANILYRNQSLTQVIYDCCRRCITYSLYKHMDICQKTLDIIKKEGSYQLFMSILSELRFRFQKSQPRYLLNTIYLNDYCIYLINGPVEDKQAQIKDFILKNIKNMTLFQEQLQLDIQNQQMGSVLQNQSQFLQSEISKNNQNQDLQILLNLD